MNRRSLFSGFAALIGVAVTAPVVAKELRGHWEIDVADGAAIPSGPLPARFVSDALPSHRHTFSLGTHNHGFIADPMPAHSHSYQIY